MKKELDILKTQKKAYIRKAVIISAIAIMLVPLVIWVSSMIPQEKDNRQETISISMVSGLYKLEKVGYHNNEHAVYKYYKFGDKVENIILTHDTVIIKLNKDKTMTFSYTKKTITTEYEGIWDIIDGEIRMVYDNNTKKMTFEYYKEDTLRNKYLLNDYYYMELTK